MRQLRLVAPEQTNPLDAESVGSAAPEGGRLVLETMDGGERFSLPLDPALRAAVRLVGQRAPTTEPRLGPREIQVRVRAGESPEELADATGTSLDWILRFAEPVLAERGRIAGEALRARARRSTTDGEMVVFGEAVDERFAAHGIDPTTVSWDAYRREDGSWALAARWFGGESEHVAEWTFHLTTGRNVTPADDTAAELLSDRPIRPFGAARDNPANPPVEPVLSLAPPLSGGVVPFPAMPDAHTGRLPRVVDVFDRHDFEDAGPVPIPPAPRVGARNPVAVPSEPVDVPEHEAVAHPPVAERRGAAAAFDEPPLPLGVPTPAPPSPRREQPARSSRGGRRGAGAANKKDEQGAERAPERPAERATSDKSARPHVPSWDDILLGVRRKQD